MSAPPPLNSNLNQFEIDDENTSFSPINMGHVGTGGMDNAAYAPAQTQFSGHHQQQQQQQGQSSGGWFQRLTSCCSIVSLQSHFDVDTEDVKDRLMGSVLHANKPDHFVVSILNKEGKKADLYGPIWITMACVFLFAVTSNTSKYLRTDSISDIEYDISHLTHALSILSFYTFVIPFALFLVFKAINVPLTFMDMVSLYGYSLVPYLPMTIMCLFPSVILEWIFLLGASALSLSLILRNVIGPVIRTSMAWSGPISIGIMGCHFVFMMVLKFTFYRHRYHKTSDGGGSSVDVEDDDANQEPYFDETVDDGGNGRW
mmetsp:Transcript_219/g.302  ORF Transcript_219/g.302 Transcript_219/m.302 type:complete len:315 (+) Transcript_219:92-1036(+)|eukprot:CAMPEP_0203662884 /NCGR_PEP_ID=MMETSP0090-20130426/689_1 /ASSEMBLY_ACC=CAM_ASM_001088 /TAXON_ID=426623 /ORGANISM="Chaetoceros affinis, Strain CCMP159" /LENGTH=314 /DNA_ID=CAMNT_0050525723 /DNA_START=71 /DNA_END=1015 /DNA_ORIENTATION=+